MRDRVPVQLRHQEGAQALEKPIPVTTPIQGVFWHRESLATESQAIPHRHTRQQTSHKRFIGEKKRMAAALTRKRDDRGLSFYRVFGACPVSSWKSTARLNVQLGG